MDVGVSVRRVKDDPGLEGQCQSGRVWGSGAGPWEPLVGFIAVVVLGGDPGAGGGGCARIAGTLGKLYTASVSKWCLLAGSSPGFCAYSSAFPYSFLL